MHNTPLMFQLDVFSVFQTSLLCTCQVISSQKSFGGLAVDVADLWLSVCSYVSTWCSVAATLPLLASLFVCFFFQALQSQSRQRRWTNNNVFNASEVTNVYCRQRSKVEIKKSFNKERITFLSTFPGKNSNGRTLRNALPNMVEHYVHFIVIAVKAEWRMF